MRKYGLSSVKFLAKPENSIEEVAGAVNVDRTPDDLREIDEAASEIEVQGARYPEKLEAMTGR